MVRINGYIWIGARFGRYQQSTLSGMTLDHDLYFISVAARMLGMHPQTLRKYERLGLVQPTRTIGSMRLYSRGELERLKVRSEEHTSELQSQSNLVCRLLLEKKKKHQTISTTDAV